MPHVTRFERVAASADALAGSTAVYLPNANNGTAFSWRDSTVCCTLDAFYDGDRAHRMAIQWHNQNEAEGVGPKWHLQQAGSPRPVGFV